MKINKALLSIIFICVCSCFAKELADYDTPTKREKKAIDRGNLIINALAAFYEDNGVYPETLEDLLPVYLDKIPNPGLRNGFNIRTKFHYLRLISCKNFTLSFRYDVFSEFYYNSYEAKWHYANH